jgi:hypothetical protein
MLPLIINSPKDVRLDRGRNRVGGNSATAMQPAATLQLTADGYFAIVIDAVDLKYRLGNVETDCGAVSIN